MRVLRMVLTLMIVTLMAAPVWADMTAVYDIEGEGELLLNYRDDQHIRMQLGEDHFLLVNGDNVWSVNRQDGEWMVMDMAMVGQMADMLGGFGMSAMEEDAEKQLDGARAADIINTGKTETIAGFKGELFQIKNPVDGKTYDAVLTDAPEVVEATQAFSAFSQGALKAMGLDNLNMADAMAEFEGKVPMGLLRQHTAFTLKSISKEAIADTQFELPDGAEPMQMPAIPAMPPMDEMMKGFNFPG